MRSAARLLARRFLSLGSTSHSIQVFKHRLQACNEAGLLLEGRRIEAEISRLGFQEDVFLSTDIVHMYLKCHSIVEARRKFDQMEHRDVVLWTAMLTAYARSGHLLEGVFIFHRMLLSGVSPNKITFLCALNSCSSLQELEFMQRLIRESDLHHEVSIGTALVKSFGKCGYLASAVDLFEQMPEPNLVSWSIIIAACNDHHQPLLALKFFRQMQLQGVAMDTIIFVTMLDVSSACSWMIPREIVMKFEREVETNVIAGTALITTCESLDEASSVFARMKVRNVVTWTALISAHCNHEDFRGAFLVFHQMQLEGVTPNAVAFVNLLNACTEAQDGELVHRFVSETGLEENNTVLGNAIVSMYGKCGRADTARGYFEKVVNASGGRDLVLWNGMFAAYAISGHFVQAAELFIEMLLLGVKPNQASYASLLMQSRRSLRANPIHLKLIRLCAEESGLKDSIAVFITAESSLSSFRDSVWWTTLISESEEQGCYSECRAYFELMQLEGVKPNELTLATVLYVFDLRRGKLLHELIIQTGVEIDVGIGTALINLYSRSRLPEESYKVFSSMEQHNTISWTAMILCYAHNDLSFPALRLYRLMNLQGFKPDAKTFTSILSACCSSSSGSAVLPISELKSIHSCVLESGYLANHYVNTTLLSVYSRFGTLEETSEMFSRSHPLQTSCWSSMIAAASRHGRCDQALLIFTRMMQEGARADDITLQCLLSACSHAGFPERALDYFVFMSHEFGVERSAEHYSCMADILGRAGRLEDAEELIRKMPFQDCLPTWMTLLGACRTQGDLHRAKQASARVSSLDPTHAQNYLVLSNVYAEDATSQESSNSSRVKDRNMQHSAGFREQCAGFMG